MGLLILTLSLIMFEGWLNYTSYIFKTLWLTNFSEPLNFVIAPLIFLFMTSLLGDKRSKLDSLHFIPFLLWLIYCLFFFSMTNEFKYNDNIRVMQLTIPQLKLLPEYTSDPLSIRNYVNQATIIHILVYIIIISVRLLLSVKKRSETIFNTKSKVLISFRNSFYHFLIITVILIFVKSTYESDVGDYLIFLYISFMIFLTSYQIMNSSKYYENASSFLEGPVIKYEKSSLTDEDKLLILKAIKNQMQNEKFFIKSTASLSGLSKELRQRSHHVSQVINEKLDQSFFEMLASYRVEEAKVILKTDLGKKLTIEEIAERVGYNSKSAFNSAFKKITTLTPSQYRSS
ncbi:helix-turn-helix domain-containing protein [uncultured Tenacibaculum sp.]|uniref:helix-turn-helix domain-containing protein n=1 Tax=uncultured Tenacibaculum sp. TaxID=174713 RepID=UPI00261B3830|nr:helix-turn-helix domain-containing protein [uncultured Tenacibaculum sp.]